MGLEPPPLTNARQVTLGWKEVARRAAAGCTAAFRAGETRVAVDIPQIGSVDRSTTARKFEDDNNFLLTLVEMLGGGGKPAPVGLRTRIKAGGFEGGGDYLSEEGLYGYRWTAPGGVGEVTAIGNSEIDSSALRDLPKLLDENGSGGGGRVILFNVNLDRLSFFDKIGLPSFDDVETAYSLKSLGPGFLSRQYPEDFCVWRLDDSAGGKPILAASQPSPFKAQQAEAALRGRTNN